MKKIVSSIGMIVFAGALIAGATGAFFSDTETSTGNVFTAGSIDLTVDSTQHYNNAVCVGGVWVLDGNAVATLDQYPVLGSACDGTWTLTDLGPTNHFFNFGDVKPGDQGENTVSLHIDSNPAYACLNITTTANDENTLVEPEATAGDVTPGPVGGGELAGNIHFQTWLDDGATDGFSGDDFGEGDNIWQVGEPALTSGALSDITGDGVDLALADSVTGTPINPGTTNYVGMFWCAGTVTGGAGNLGCDGAAMGNTAQTDSVTADVTFNVVQTRNNASFVCGDAEPPSPLIGAEDLETASLVSAKGNDKWFFYNDTNDTIMTINQFSGGGGVNDIVAGPGAEGAAQMTLDDSTSRYNIATYRYQDELLSGIGSLNYRIYDASASAQTPYLHFNVDFNNTDTWQNRLVQVPTGVVEDTWTTVNALAGSWTYSGAFWPAGLVDVTGTTPGSTARTWADILANYPNAETRSTDSFLGVRVGHPGPDGEESYVSWIEFDGETTDFGI